MSESSAASRGMTIARWVIYALVALTVVLPYFVVFPTLKYKVSPESAKLFDKVNSLKPGAHVMIAFDYDPASSAELDPMGRAILLHCFKKGLIPVVMTHWSSGLDNDRKILAETAARAQEDMKRQEPFVSGRDYVFLGFRPGYSNLVLNMGENLKGSFDKDFYGQPTAAMSALQGVSQLKDLDLVIDLAAGASVEVWIAFGSDRFHFPLGVGSVAVQAPNIYPYLQSGQVCGLLGGLRGAADYEQLVDANGAAMRSMWSQSLAHVLIIGLILFANARMLLARYRRTGKATG